MNGAALRQINRQRRERINNQAPDATKPSMTLSTQRACAAVWRHRLALLDSA